MSRQQSSQRKQCFVDGHVQGALLRRIFSHWIAFFLISAITVILFQTLIGDPATTFMQRIRLESREFMFMAIVMMTLFPAFMLDTIRFSNRFVGPISRIRRHLRQLGSGKIVHCTFRNDDFWSELAGEFNVVADLVESQKLEIAKLRTLVETTDESIQEEVGSTV